MDRTLVNVAIIGCGLIGARWDAIRGPNDAALTHAAAFSKHPDATVVAVCDADSAKAQWAAERWGVPRAYTDARQLFIENPIELAVFAASSSSRWQLIEPAIQAGIKVFVIEKPLANSVAECRRLTRAIHVAGAKSVVNFSRRWDPAMSDLRQAVRSGELGPIQRLVGFYGKGLVNNGSHLIDLAGFLCDAVPVRARSLGSPLDADEGVWSAAGDAAVDAQVLYADQSGAKFHLSLVATDQRAFTCFELRLIGSKALCEISHGGRKLTRTSIEADPTYAGYRIPGEPISVSARLLETMDRMADEAVLLAQGMLQQSRCDAASALHTALTADAIQHSGRMGGIWIDIAAHHRQLFQESS